MAFPASSILDDFLRANEDPLSDGGKWTGPVFSGHNTLKLLSDAATSAGASSLGDSYWSAASFILPVEVFATWSTFSVGDVGAGVPSLFACLSGENTGSENGYVLKVLPTVSEVQVIRWDEGGFGDTLVSISDLTISDGDGFGMAIAAGGTITVYQAPGGTGWTLIGSGTDTTYTSGHIGAGYFEDDSAFAPMTSFGGGEGAEPPAIPSPQGRGLHLTACDLNGNVLTSGNSRPLPVRTPQQPQVTIPLSDSRTGQIDVSMYEAVAGPIAHGAGDVVVKVLYTNPKGGNVLLINGIVLQPTSDFDAGTVTATLHDSTIRLKKRFLGYNHASILLGIGTELTNADPEGTAYSSAVLSNAGLGEFFEVRSVYGIPLDGYGLRLLLLDTSHGAADWHGWPYPTSDEFVLIPAMGIRYQPGYSIDEANRQPAYGADGVPPQGFAFTATITKGSTVLTDVVLPGSLTPEDVYQYGALFDSAGKLDPFAQVVSATSTSDGDIIVMSQPALADGTDVTIVLEAAIYCQLSRGDCVFDDITDMVQAQGAFECDWIPVDKDNTGMSGATWVEGQLCELFTANRVGTDRSQGGNAPNGPGDAVPVVFVHGLGGVHVVFEPDADSLITDEVQVGPGGPYDALDILNRVDYFAPSQDTYGIWEDWQQATSAGTGDTPISNAVLTNRARATLTAYQAPPKFATVTIDRDSIARYAYGTDFFLGDTVTIVARRGSVMVVEDMRITQVGIAQIDAEGNCQLSLTVVPHLTANPGVQAGPN